jgi:hypothetical protein
MKIDVLSIGAFPEATNAELAKHFAVTRYLQRPARMRSPRISRTASEASRPRPTAAPIAR